MSAYLRNGIISAKVVTEDAPQMRALNVRGIAWWFNRRSNWSDAYRNTQLAKTNLAEAGNSRYRAATKTTLLDLEKATHQMCMEYLTHEVFFNQFKEGT